MLVMMDVNHIKSNGTKVNSTGLLNNQEVILPWNLHYHWNPKVYFKKLAVRTFWLIAIEDKKYTIKRCTSFKRSFKVGESKALKIFKNSKMKMKHEEEKKFFYLAKIFQFMFFWSSKLRWFQICIQIFHIFLQSKVTNLQVG